MPPRIHPCLCGFVCTVYTQMKRHRAKCAQWKDRRDPLQVTLERRAQTRAEHEQQRMAKAPICIECRQRLDHHDPTCSWNQAEIIRRAALVKNDIDPEIFEVFLRVLAKRYRK